MTVPPPSLEALAETVRAALSPCLYADSPSEADGALEEAYAALSALFARAERAETALADTAETFEVFASALALLGHPTMARAAAIAGEGTRAALTAVGETALPEPDDVGTGRDSVGTYASRTKPETVSGSGSAASEEGT